MPIFWAYLNSNSYGLYFSLSFFSLLKYEDSVSGWAFRGQRQSKAWLRGRISHLWFIIKHIKENNQASDKILPVGKSEWLKKVSVKEDGISVTIKTAMLCEPFY